MNHNAPSDLLKSAIAAHGGLERWNRIAAVQVAASITGAIWHVKGQPDYLADIVMTVDKPPPGARG